jgi:hypothetical protein
MGSSVRLVQPVRRHRCLGASVLIAAVGVLLVALQPLTSGQAPVTGTITGHVTLATRLRGAALPNQVYTSRAVTRYGPPPIPEVQNVVVYLKGVVYRGELPPMRRQIRQEGESFVPRVVPITAGSTIEFPNFDPFFHNVFSLSTAGTFDLGRYPEGQARERQFTKPGLVKVFCHIHSHMSASVLVLSDPYFAVPNEDGTFALPNVPPGNYTLVAWHERVGERLTSVSVQGGQATTIDISLPIGDAR